MRHRDAVQVGVRELKNNLTAYLRLTKERKEVIVTERGKPIAVIQPLGRTAVLNSIEARLAALAAKGEITLPTRALRSRIRRVKIAGRPVSEQIVADRR